MKTFQVKVHSPDSSDVINAIEARQGFPVEIKLWYTPKTCTSWHLSFAEFDALAKAMQSIKQAA